MFRSSQATIRRQFLATFLLAFALLFTAARATAAQPVYYASIAYSVKTARWGTGYGYTTRQAADATALKACGQKDAVIVTWAKGGWYCALAKGSGTAWGTASDPTAQAAKAGALRSCLKHSPQATILRCVRAAKANQQ